ncbi:MAG: DUF6249 domain-containing protein [Planctomycetota bacterium]
MHDIADGLTVFIIFLGFSSPIIVVALAFYFIKRLKHKEILAAIEKGVPISELNLEERSKSEDTGPGWVKDISSGIMFLLIAVGFTALLLLGIFKIATTSGTYPLFLFAIPIVFFGIGIGRLIRGIIRRKNVPQILNSGRMNEDSVEVRA